MTAALLATAPAAATASFLQGEALDQMADVMAWIVMIVVPAGVLVVFWLIHVLPEKIAHRRHHPQRDAIKTLCLLSLVFGGLLWPIAWLWAYTRPTSFKRAYGTDKHEDFYVEQGVRAAAGTLPTDELAQLRADLDVMAARGGLPAGLRRLRDDLDAQAALAAAPIPGAAARAAPPGAASAASAVVASGAPPVEPSAAPLVEASGAAPLSAPASQSPGAA